MPANISTVPFYGSFIGVKVDTHVKGSGTQAMLNTSNKFIKWKRLPHMPRKTIAQMEKQSEAALESLRSVEKVAATQLANYNKLILELGRLLFGAGGRNDRFVDPNKELIIEEVQNLINYRRAHEGSVSTTISMLERENKKLWHLTRVVVHDETVKINAGRVREMGNEFVATPFDY